MQHMLSLLIWFPIAMGVLIFAVGDDARPNIARGLGLFAVLVSLLLCVPLMLGFDF